MVDCVCFCLVVCLLVAIACFDLFCCICYDYLVLGVDSYFVCLLFTLIILLTYCLWLLVFTI